MTVALEFSEKIAVITGGGTGVGLATAKFLAEKGCQLALIGRRIEKLDEAKNGLKPLGTHVEVFAGDVNKDSDVWTIFQKIYKDFGRLDFLVNNAGINKYKKVEEITASDIDEEISVKSRGIIFCTREASKLMHEGSAIVNITSVTAFLGGQSSPAYAAANAAANNLTKSFAQKLAGQKIRVNAVAPGFIFPTGFTQNYDPEKLKKLAEVSLMKRVASPEDVAKAIYFLLSDLSSYITGHTLHVNGGYYMN
ncbi:MAG: SDR family oxidoreductase [Patescibacteria group bacterium]|nr:SDR family oxidoreductase [Patescibacteria group bacterium]